jgi:type II secretory pathway pseudopilin PulG
MRFRISTMMIVVLILALITALIVQGMRAGRREADLRAQLQAAMLEKKLSELALSEHEAIRQAEVSQLRSRIEKLTRTQQEPESGMATNQRP